MYNMKALGAICKNHRERIGITQQEAARITGYTQANISAFENGKSASINLLLWYLEKGIDVDNVKEAIHYS